MCVCARVCSCVCVWVGAVTTLEQEVMGPAVEQNPSRCVEHMPRVASTFPRPSIENRGNFDNVFVSFAGRVWQCQADDPVPWHQHCHIAWLSMFEEIVDRSREEQALEMVDFFAAEVPQQLTNNCIKFICKNFPHDDSFRHLRKIRKTTVTDLGDGSTECADGAQKRATSRIELLLFPREKQKENNDAKLAALTSHDQLPCALSPYIVKVPRFPAPTREIVQTVTEGGAWPQKFLPQKKAAAPPITPKEEEVMLNFMTQLKQQFQMDHSNKDATCSCRQAVFFVDPRTQSIVARASDVVSQSQETVLNHAVVRCIRELSQKQRARSAETRAERKRARLSTTHQDSKAGVEEGSVSRPSTDEDVEYLATGFHAYLEVEPCPMCAMALVHSRVARVVWKVPNKKRGALGSRYSLHLKTGLNHHYRVFKYTEPSHSETNQR